MPSYFTLLSLLLTFAIHCFANPCGDAFVRLARLQDAIYLGTSGPEGYGKVAEDLITKHVDPLEAAFRAGETGISHSATDPLFEEIRKHVTLGGGTRIAKAHAAMELLQAALETYKKDGNSNNLHRIVQGTHGFLRGKVEAKDWLDLAFKNLPELKDELEGDTRLQVAYDLAKGREENPPLPDYRHPHWLQVQNLTAPGYGPWTP